jgi:hypothetical protein
VLRIKGGENPAGERGYILWVEGYLKSRFSLFFGNKTPLISAYNSLFWGLQIKDNQKFQNDSCHV